MRSKKILYCIPSLSNSGGMERVLTEKVNYLVSRGEYNIFIVTTEMSDSDISFFDLNSAINVINLKFNFNEKFNLNIFDKVIETKKLLKKYEEELKNIVLIKKIDICISMGGKELEFLGGLSIPCKKIYECHFEKKFKSKFLELQGKNNFFWKLFGKLRDWQHFLLASKFDMVVVLSDGAAKDWAKLSNQVLIVANPSPIPLNMDLKINLSNKRIISIGNLITVKGYDLLISAWALIAPRYPEWSLDIFGKGELHDDLQNQVDCLMLTNSIRLVGTTKDIKSELEKSSFYVMSSRSEALPMVLIESITCGLPIVAFDCETGPREIIQDNDCGILVENGNVEKLAFNIERMILDTELRKEMSIRALEKSKKYELTHIMEKWEKIFQDLVS